MPEGDNIHRHASGLQEQLVGRTVTALWARGVAYPRLVGQTVAQVEARGKHLLIDIGPARVHVHLGMQGRLRVGPPSPLAPSLAARASLVVATDAANAIWWRAPQVEILRAAFAHAHPVLAALGPDVLAPAFDPAGAVARARQRPADTALGPLLLDQRVASGIGNVYKSEVLFLERMDPFATISSVDDAALSRLYARAQQLMQQNLGPWRRTTTRDMSRGGPTPRGEAALHVYRRARHPCRVCGSAIQLAYQGEPPRSTYYCPTCQKSGE
ncbi:MAG: Fpg/Nei family DNA glycosylase [Polyangia bacterium]